MLLGACYTACTDFDLVFQFADTLLGACFTVCPDFDFDLANLTAQTQLHTSLTAYKFSVTVVNVH